jgi:uncharacterized membrane-anchored protein
MIRLPEHPMRRRLHDEINARPYEPLESPERISYLAYLVDEREREREAAHIAELCRHYGQSLPAAERKCFHLRLGELRVKVEWHEEFTRYTFILAGAADDPFGEAPICRIPVEWVARIPGKLLVAIHAAVLPASPDAAEAGPEAAAARFSGGRLVGSRLASGAVTAYTDFRIHEDGFSRWLLFDHCGDPAQVGRTLLRLLEIETYRMLALLAVPLAGALRLDLRTKDRQLVELTAAVAGGSRKTDEELLEDLSKLAADIENLVSTHQYRFDATRAYFGLVVNRISQLREVKIGELSTLSGFLNRRLEPARDSCDSSMRWLETLATRVTNASQLLRTRTDVRREQQNHALLAAMNRRSHLQLRLQQAVEGLSLAAITYAGVSLLGIIGGVLFKKGLFPFDGSTVEALAIPFVAAAVWMGTGHIREAARESD